MHQIPIPPAPPLPINVCREERGGSFVYRERRGLTDGLVEEEGFADVFDFGDCAF